MRYNTDAFGRIIAKQRRALHMTQEQLAAELQITPQAVSKWENGIGLPDVTLFPHIAEILQLPIEQLFGAGDNGDDGTDAGCAAQTYEGLPLVSVYGPIACYSSKEVESVQNGTVTFRDGSCAELGARTVVNRGPGEIRLRDLTPSSRYADKDGYTCFDKRFSLCDRLSVSLNGNCSMRVHRAKEGEGSRVYAEGSSNFLSRLSTTEQDGTLTVTLKSRFSASRHDDSEIDIWVAPLCHRLVLSLSGSTDVEVDPDCAETVLKVNGSGDIALREAGQLNISVAGSGDINCLGADSASVRVAGSGDVELGTLHGGSLSVIISGSGDVSCHGETDSLNLAVTGSGTFDGTELTAREAGISMSGSGDATVGRVLEKTTEKTSFSSTIHILQRG